MNPRYLPTVRRQIVSATAIAIVAFAGLGSSPGSSETTPPPGTDQTTRTTLDTLLARSWSRYKERFIQADGRVIDFNDNGVSTSEGQAYGLLRAAWMDDPATFQRVLDWTDHNLNAGIRSDHLHAWKWGPRDDGSWGVHDRTSATDADEIIALALITAGERWKRPDLLARAVALLNDIWTLQTRVIRGTRFVMGGDWPIADGPMRINPSYYFPTAYRTFARIDSVHPWETLVDTTYQVIAACRSKTGLPTNWCSIDPATGLITIASDLHDRSSDFGYDAFRVLWNLAADYVYHQDPRALETLRTMDWLRRCWLLRHHLPAVITADGIPLVCHDYVGMYGAYLPALTLLDPLEARRLLHSRLLTAYHDGLWGNPADYYAQNWAWFGLHLYRQALDLPNQNRQKPNH